MRAKWIIMAALLVLLAASATAAYLTYSGQRERLAPNVVIADEPLGGLTREQAEQRLARKFAYLQEKVIVRHGAEQTTLKASRFANEPDIAGALAKAEIVGDEGFIAWAKEQASPKARAEIAVDVDLDKRKLRRWVNEYADAHRVEPRDARLSVSYTLKVIKGRSGRAIKRERLLQDLTRALSGEAKAVEAKTQTVKPEIATRQDLTKKYPTYVTVSQQKFRVRVYKRLKLVKTFPVATGLPAYPTPRGQFKITNKAVNPVWTVPNSPWAGELQGQTVAGGTAENPLKARWLGLVDGVGFHGTSDDASIGSRASHGCLRMHVRDVIKLYPMLPVGTPVLIV